MPDALCPVCGTSTHHIHSRYERTIWDILLQNVQGNTTGYVKYIPNSIGKFTTYNSTIELTRETCKSELGIQSAHVWDWETRLKLLGLATLAFAFLLHLLSTPFKFGCRWLLRYACHRTRRRLLTTRVPLARVQLALIRLWLAYPPLLESTGQSSAFREGNAPRICGSEGVPLTVNVSWQSENELTLACAA